MDILGWIDRSNTCLARENPPCACACPLGVDVRGMVGKIQTGALTAAYKVYEKSVVFPEIISHICDEPCQSRCVRGDLDASISLKALEQACCSQVKGGGASYFIPNKGKKVLIIGAGLCGLSCAVKLARRGYSVELVEQKDHVGGRLWEMDEAILPRDVLEKELARVTKHKYLNIKLDETAADLDSYTFDVALVATGSGGADFGAQPGDGRPVLRDGVFFGGTLVEAKKPLYSVRDGIALSYAIEAYLQVGSMKVDDEHFTCTFQTKTEGVQPQMPLQPADPDHWTKEEAVREANRCLLCQCKTCTDVCDMLAHYNKEPRKTVMDILESVNKTEITSRIALRQINSCTQCGLCTTTCPVGIDFKDLCIESRRELHRGGALPESMHEFWLRDMAFGNGENAALTMPPEGKQTANYLFFPGCQLGASDPDYVTETYRLLDEVLDHDVALMLHCCGAPAWWSGREALHSEVCAKIKEDWTMLGKPEFILACPTCVDMFRAHMPDLPVRALWDLSALQNLPLKQKAETLSVFDPCSARATPDTRENVRALVKQAGYALEELSASGEMARCCGYGGLIYSANPALYDKINAKNVGLGEHDYVAYCSNCRDSFAQLGKRAYHILDLLLFDDPDRASRRPPSITQRRVNRQLAKQNALKAFWNIDFTPQREESESVTLHVSDEMTHKMNRELIHENNVKRCILHAEETRSIVYNPAREVYICHLQQGVITYWVEYKKGSDGSFTLENVYRHRMMIEETVPRQG